MYKDKKQTKKDKDKIDTESREHNAKIAYDSIRKDLDIQLSSTIPTQKNLMKTLLWINFTFLGVLWVAINHLDKSIMLRVCISLAFIFSIATIAYLLTALTKGQKKTFGSLDINYIDSLHTSDYPKLYTLLYASHVTKDAFDTNAKTVIEPRALNLRLSTKFTIASSICTAFAIMLIGFNLMK